MAAATGESEPGTAEVIQIAVDGFHIGGNRIGAEAAGDHVLPPEGKPGFIKALILRKPAVQRIHRAFKLPEHLPGQALGLLMVKILGNASFTHGMTFKVKPYSAFVFFSHPSARLSYGA